jgi:DNA-binding GntR family transcriptional regulator
MSRDGRPFEVAESWWPVSIAGGTALAEPRRIKGGAVTLLAEMGYAVHRTVEDVWAAPAPEEEAGLLEIEPGSPVLVMLRTAFNADGLAFQVDPAMRLANARQRYELTAN